MGLGFEPFISGIGSTHLTNSLNNHCTKLFVKIWHFKASSYLLLHLLPEAAGFKLTTIITDDQKIVDPELYVIVVPSLQLGRLLVKIFVIFWTFGTYN